MRYRLQYLPVALLVRLVGACPARWRVDADSPGRTGLLSASAGCAASECAIWKWPSRKNLPTERRKILRGVYVSLGRLLGGVLPVPALHRGQRVEGRGVSGIRKLRSCREARQRSALSHRTLWRLGDRFVLSLPARATPCGSWCGRSIIPTWMPGHPLPDAAWQQRDRQEGFARGLAGGHGRQRNRRHSDGHQHDSAARRVRGFLRHSRVHRRGMARVALHTGAAVVPAFTIWDPVLRKYRVEFDRALELVRTARTRPMPSPIPRCSTGSSKTTCASIPTNGCGCTADGRPDRRRAGAVLDSLFALRFSLFAIRYSPRGCVTA